MKPEDWLAERKTHVLKALRAWYKPNADTSPLEDLEIFRQRLLQGANNARQATNEILLDSLEALEVDNPEDANLLRMRFLEGKIIPDAAARLNVSEATYSRWQRRAVEQLALILQAKEAQAEAKRWNKLEAQLPPAAYVKLIGVEDQRRLLQEALTAPEAPWLISIEGLGGIGKTTLAGALVRRAELRRHFDDIAWVSAKQQDLLFPLAADQTPLPALTPEALIDSLLEQFDISVSATLSLPQKQAVLVEHLNKGTSLLVIDNLETVVDFQTLLPLLRKLTNPGKVLLTSRHSLQAHPGIFCLSLRELNRADTLRFIHYEAKVRGQFLLAEASESQLVCIYTVVGGNPLALKLVIGQMAILPLPQVLANLQEARGQKVDDLYTFVYWQAWQMLSPAGQTVLLAMPLAPDGDLAQLAAVSKLEADELNEALEKLATLSLVEVGGDLEERRYRIHRLTETFLLNEVAKWQAKNSNGGGR